MLQREAHNVTETFNITERERHAMSQKETHNVTEAHNVTERGTQC